MPYCSRCKEELPVECFQLRKSGLKKGETNGYCIKCNRKKAREYYYKHVTERREYRENHKEHYSKLVKDKTQNMRAKVITHYSNGTNKCVCCGEAEPRFLTIDHINGGGKKERKESGRNRSYSFYKNLIKNNYPEGLQVLCFNCNCGRQLNGGICPHKNSSKDK